MREKAAILLQLRDVISTERCNERFQSGIFIENTGCNLGAATCVIYYVKCSYLLKRSRRVLIMSCVIESRS